MVYKTVLLVLNIEEEVTWTPFTFNLEHLQGFYLDPDDRNNMNVVINGTSFTIPFDEQIIKFMEFDERSVL